MTILEVSKIINGKVNNCSLKKKIRNIKFDSKKVLKNDLFICIKGKNKDGHDYIKEAIKNGAVWDFISFETVLCDGRRDAA